MEFRLTGRRFSAVLHLTISGITLLLINSLLLVSIECASSHDQAFFSSLPFNFLESLAKLASPLGVLQSFPSVTLSSRLTNTKPSVT